MKDTPMTIRELRSALAGMPAESPVQVVLFKNDGTSEMFELEEVLHIDGHAQLEIYEPETPQPPSGS
jgi:hypothetical protein